MITPFGPGLADQLEEPLALVREVHPLLEAVVFGDDLDAGNQEPDLGRDAELLGEPAPLVLAEDRGLRVRVAFVGSLAVAGPAFSLQRLLRKYRVSSRITWTRFPSGPNTLAS